MFPRAGRNISPQTDGNDVSRETSLLSIRREIATTTPDILDLSILTPERRGKATACASVNA
jgi:hypothetical protein